MSRNFELMRRAEQTRRLFETAGGAPASSAGKGMNPPGEALLQEEVAMVHRVFMTPGKNAPRVVVFCGADREDLSSSVCARAASILATQRSGTVCLADADVYGSTLGRHFGANGNAGFIDVLLHGKSVHDVTHEVSANLWLLSCGSSSFQGQVVMTFQRVRDCLSELRAQFDYVLIDAPSVNAHADVLSIGPLADGVILVVKSNSTRREAALRAKERLMAANVRLIGAVLTDRTFPIPYSIYRRL